MTPFDMLICLVLSVLCTGAFLLFFGITYLFERKKTEDGWQAFAARHRLTYTSKPRLVTGLYRDRMLRLEPFTSFNPFGADIDGTKLSLPVKNPSGWKLTIETGAGAGRIGKIFGVPEVKTGIQELDEKYTFRSEPSDLVARLLQSPALRQYLLTTKQYVKLSLENDILYENPLDKIEASYQLSSWADWLCIVAEKLENLINKEAIPPVASSPVLEKFLKSMNIGYAEWHDGVGYDLDALRELRGDELRQVEDLLISRKDSDWRDVEALATLKTPRAVEALKECLSSPNIDVRLFAVRYLKEMNIEDRVEEVVVSTLPETKIGQGLTYALALAKDYPTESIKQKLLWCCVHGNDDIRVHCAAMALFLYGKAASEFDPKQTIVFKFKDKDEAKRLEAFSELSRMIKE